MQQSFLSNYDPSALHAGLAWAAQRQQARDLWERQLQEEAARKQQLEQEGEIQRRNEAAKLAIQYQHEANELKRLTPIQVRERELASKQMNITAQYNWATEQESGSGNPKDFKTYRDSLNVLQDKINNVDTSQDVDWSQFNLPPTPDRLPGQAELDEAKRTNEKDQVDLDYKRAQIRSFGETARHHRTMEGISATRAHNSGAKLNQWQRSQLKGASVALGAYNEANHPPAGLDEGKRKAFVAQNQALYEKYAPALMYSIRDPDLATQMGLDPMVASSMADEAGKHNSFATVGDANSYLNTKVLKPDEEDLQMMSAYAPYGGGPVNSSDLLQHRPTPTEGIWQQTGRNIVRALSGDLKPANPNAVPNPNGKTVFERYGIFDDNPAYKLWNKHSRQIQGFFQGNIPPIQETTPTEDNAYTGGDD